MTTVVQASIIYFYWQQIQERYSFGFSKQDDGFFLVDFKVSSGLE